MTYHDPIDAAFAIIITLFALLFVAVIVAAIVRAIDRGARQEGYEEGYKQGVTAERLRWHEVEMRAEEEMIRRAMQGDEFTQTELDA